MSKKVAVILIALALVLGLGLGIGGTLLVKNAKNTAAVDTGKDTGMVGGVQMANPVAGLSREEALEIAVALAEGKDMGSWQTMSADEFLRWWADSNQEELNPEE